MVKRLSTATAQASLGAVLDAVYATNEPVVVEQQGRPIAVIISPEQYEEWQRQEDARDWAIIEAVAARRADQDPDAILAEVTALVEAVRQEEYERQRSR